MHCCAEKTRRMGTYIHIQCVHLCKIIIVLMVVYTHACYHAPTLCHQPLSLTHSTYMHGWIHFVQAQARVDELQSQSHWHSWLRLCGSVYRCKHVRFPNVSLYHYCTILYISVLMKKEWTFTLNI